MNHQRLIIVVARYNENLDWLKKAPWEYIVFNKGKKNLPKWIKNEVKLPNIGREAHTYLTFITNNYDNLPDYTIFVQGDPFVHSKNLIEKINGFEGGVDFFPLADRIPGRKSKYLSRFFNFTFKVIESAKKIFIDDINFFEYPAGAQFILSKKAILFHTKLTYQKILDFMIEGQLNSDKCVSGLHKTNCKCTSLFSPWVMERLWKILFDNKHKTIYD